MQERGMLVFVVCGLALAACGGKDSAAPSGDALEVATTEVDAKADTPDVDLAWADTAGESSAPNDTDEDTEGVAGSPCNSQDDCLGSTCFFSQMSPTGGVCVEQNWEGCPDGYIIVCDPIWGCVDDGSAWCVPLQVLLCLPCMGDADCDLTGAHCLDYGADGRYCGAPCSAQVGCPEGFTCEEASAAGGTTVKECVLDDGECWCAPGAAGWNESPVTECLVDNEVGTCHGQRSCDETGLSACDAPEPETEACDGIDNDCDGLLDEGFDDFDQDGVLDCCVPNDGCAGGVGEGTAGGGCFVQNEYGICYGFKKCLYGLPVCDAPTPEAEACDGLNNDCDDQVDEGFLDVNMDCMGDCVDLDADGDGVPDYGDNCPLFPNPDQKDSDDDGMGDACDDDQDGDGLLDVGDNCPYAANPDQTDSDDDGQGDACAGGDTDGDGVLDGEDCDPLNHLVFPGAEEVCDYLDNDCDGLVNDGFPNPDGIWGPFNDCVSLDEDWDCVADAGDNCPGVKNRGQLNFDNDGLGNACDPDIDGDGVGNDTDCDSHNPWTFLGAPERCDGKDNDCDGEKDEEAAETDCQDCDPCTSDECDPAKGCLHEPVECPEGRACNEWGKCE